MATVQRVTFKGENSTNLLEQLNSTHTNKKIKEKKAAAVNTKDMLVYANTAVGLASLGIAGIYAVKHGKLNKKFNILAGNVNDSASEISKVSQNLKNSIDELTEKITSGLNERDQRIVDLGKWQDGQINGLREDLTSRIQQIVTSVKTPGMGEIYLSPVDVNGMELNLATVLNGYGKHTQEIEKSLRKEAAKRIFGIVDRSEIVPPDNIMVRVPTSEFKGFSSTGGMSIVPKEVIANLGAIINSKQGVNLVVDTPLYLGQVEDNVYYSIVKNSDGLFSYMSSKSQKPIAKLEKIDTMHLPIYTDKGKTNEAVEVYLARGNEQIVDIDLLKPWLDKKLAKRISRAINKGEAFEINEGVLKIKYDPADEKYLKPTALVKYDTVFYKHDKFRMDGPVFDGKAKNIYNGVTHESGETERFIYFDKFFYEHLLRNSESSNVPLRADLIIGNDWQTGGISAMMKLLTTVKRYFGLDPKIADKIYNTPILTIMHNAGLSGDVWHSQPKLLNVMFGEHASMITRNAWMPRNSNLNGASLNGLFHDKNLNPQTMAAAYSDVITPVSKGYGHEMASHSGFGGNNHDIFRMRARYHEFNDIEYLKKLAVQNGLNPDLVKETNLSYRPITNGSDRVNNVLTDLKAREIENALGLKRTLLRVPKPGDNIYEIHQHNKDVYLNKVISDINMARSKTGNPMNIELPEMTNLEGVTKNTMVVSTAGRIVDQKGLDIFAQSIDEFLRRHINDKDLPVFYAQGVGEQVFIDKLLDVKRRIAIKYGSKAAERIVFARLFSEPGRYDGCKLMSDFTVMSSWFEPCGLVHKEIAPFSGAIPIVNKVGGLTDGLTDMSSAIFSEFKPKFDNYEDAIGFNRNAFADALDRAYELYKNKLNFKRVLINSFELNHSWLKPNGPMEEYARIFVDLKVLRPEVLNRTA